METTYLEQIATLETECYRLRAAIRVAPPGERGSAAIDSISQGLVSRLNLLALLRQDLNDE